MCSFFFRLFCDVVFVVFRTRGACLCLRGEVCGSGRLSGVAPPTLPRWARPCPRSAGRAPAAGRPLRPGVTRGGGGGGRQFRAGAGAAWTCGGLANTWLEGALPVANIGAVKVSGSTFLSLCVWITNFARFCDICLLIITVLCPLHTQAILIPDQRDRYRHV